MQDKKYWQERMINQVLMGERSVLEYERMLEDAYNASLAEINKEIQAFYGKYAKDNQIPYAEARRRLNAGELKEFQALLKKWYALAQEHNMSREYIEYLKELGNRVYISRLESLQASIRAEIEALKTDQYKSMTELLFINYMAAYYAANYTMTHGLGFSVNFAEIDKLGIETAVKTRWDKRNYSDSIWNDKDKLLDTMNKILPQSFSRGLNSNKLGDMIAKELNTSKNKGRALARTEVNYLCNQADLTTYKAIGIEKYEFLATLDLRTSEICRGMDEFIGKVTQATVGVNFPPMHVNCRSTTIPHFEDQEVEERVARNQEGKTIKVPRRMSQESWIKQYVPEEQQENLLKFMKKFYTEEKS